MSSPFRADQVGSLLRPARLLQARQAVAAGSLSREVLREQEDAAILEALARQRDVGIPVLPFLVYPLTALLPRSRAVDRVLGGTIERGTVARLLDSGYVDCFRHLHPRAHGYTCATRMPAARIDYIFADRLMASTLRRCEVVGGRLWPDREATAASDHYPVVAEFSV